MREEFAGSGIFIMSCSNCNTQCKHCYISYKGNFDGDELYNLCKILIKRYRVFLNGTEVLIHPEYFKTMKLIRQKSLLTNGIEINRKPSIIPQLVDIGIEYIGSSYHFGIHDEISSVNPKIVEENIKPLREYGIGTDLRVTINSKNYHLVREMCDGAYRMGARGIKFTNYMLMGRAVNLDKSNILTDEQLQTFFKLLNESRKKYSKDELLIRRCGSFGYSEASNFYCPACEDAVTITPSLKVYPCNFLVKEGMEIGYVENGKVIITRKLERVPKMCLAREINNNDFKL